MWNAGAHQPPRASTLLNVLRQGRICRPIADRPYPRRRLRVRLAPDTQSEGCRASASTMTASTLQPGLTLCSSVRPAVLMVQRLMA